MAHRLLPAVRVLPTTDSRGASRFSRAQRAPSFYACVGSSTPQGLRRAGAAARRSVAFRSP